MQTVEEFIEIKASGEEMKAKNSLEGSEEDEGSSTEEVLSDTETIDVSMEDFEVTKGQKSEHGDQYNELMYKAVGASWDEVDVEDSAGLPPPLALHANIHSLKLDLLSSIFQVQI